MVDLSEDKDVRKGYMLTYESLINAISYKWLNGMNESTIFTNESGTYILTVANNCGTHSDSIDI